MPTEALHPARAEALRNNAETRAVRARGELASASALLLSLVASAKHCKEPVVQKALARSREELAVACSFYVGALDELERLR
jgi:DMSO/TMAO reductase YedYZ heme-binding membrane subunit